MGYPLLDVKTDKPKSNSEQIDQKDKIEVETETPEKPKWFSCVAFTVSALTIIITAISVGMVIGYSYCYFEHRTELLEKNYTRLGTLEIVDASDMMTETPLNVNQTINGAIKQALMSSILFSKLSNMVHHLAEDTAALDSDDHHVIAMTNMWDVFPEQNIVAL